MKKNRGGEIVARSCAVEPDAPDGGDRHDTDRFHKFSRLFQPREFSCVLHENEPDNGSAPRAAITPRACDAWRASSPSRLGPPVSLCQQR
jgi:hypothetical protein